jgi:hypothetical protein
MWTFTGIIYRLFDNIFEVSLPRGRYCPYHACGTCVSLLLDWICPLHLFGDARDTLIFQQKVKKIKRYDAAGRQV